MAYIVFICLFLVIQETAGTEEVDSLLDDLEEKLAMSLKEEDKRNVANGINGEHTTLYNDEEDSSDSTAEELKRSNDIYGGSSTDASDEQEGERLIRLLSSTAEKRYHKHCGPRGLNEICVSSHDCCCGYHCRRFRCLKHFLG